MCSVSPIFFLAKFLSPFPQLYRVSQKEESLKPLATLSIVSHLIRTIFLYGSFHQLIPILLEHGCTGLMDLTIRNKKILVRTYYLYSCIVLLLLLYCAFHALFLFLSSRQKSESDTERHCMCSVHTSLQVVIFRHLLFSPEKMVSSTYLCAARMHDKIVAR